MSDINFRLNVRSSDFPLLSTQFGRTVMQASPEDYNNTMGRTYAETFRDRYGANASYLYYHNVLPTIVGMRSINFRKTYGNIVAASGQQVNYANYLRDCHNRRLLLLSTPTGNYTPIDATTWRTLGGYNITKDKCTIAHVYKKSYICMANTGIQYYDEGSQSLLAVNLNGLLPANIIGLSTFSNYLIAYSEDTIFWSSAINPEDFLPSLSTGAGSIIPNTIRGTIVYCHAINTGFLIFTSDNVVHAKYTGNLNFPFAFTEILNAGGITKASHVVRSTMDDGLYYWSNKGCQLITLPTITCDNTLPELQDFLTSHVVEDYITSTTIPMATNISTNWSSQTQSWEELPTETTGLVQTSYTGSLAIGIRIISNRYLVVSYGVPNTTNNSDIFKWAFIYDIQLLRWGKVRITHIDCIDMQDTLGSSDLTISYEPNHNIGFVQPDGSTYILTSELDDLTTNDSCIYFGKLQHDRNKITCLSTIEIESTYQGNTNLEILTSLDGKNTNPAIQPMNQIDSPNLQKWLMRTTGVSHTLRITGVFDISGIYGSCVLVGGR